MENCQDQPSEAGSELTSYSRACMRRMYSSGFGILKCGGQVQAREKERRRRIRVSVGEEAPFGTEAEPSDDAGGERPETSVLSKLLPKGVAELEPVRILPGTLWLCCQAWVGGRAGAGGGEVGKQGVSMDGSGGGCEQGQGADAEKAAMKSWR